jgi:hypothetical protein
VLLCGVFWLVSLRVNHYDRTLAHEIGLGIDNPQALLRHREHDLHKSPLNCLLDIPLFIVAVFTLSLLLM